MVKYIVIIFLTQACGSHIDVSKNIPVTSNNSAEDIVTDNDENTSENNIPKISIANISTQEVNLMEFTVILDKAYNEDIFLNWSTMPDGSATEGIDFIGVDSETKMIPAGQTSTVLVVSLIDDGLVESDESVNIKIDSISVGELENNIAIGTITDTVLCSSTDTHFNSVGLGSAADPWQICTAEQLKDIGDNGCGVSANTACSAGSTFRLMNDIDMSAVNNFEPIGHNSYGYRFRGNFYGHNKVISNLSIIKPGNNEVGLFGSAVGSIIQDLLLDNVNISGNNNVGGVVGHCNNCSLSNIEVRSGSLSSSGVNTGGIAGHIIGSNTHSNLKNSLDLDSVNLAGGIFGLNGGEIIATNLKNDGNISGSGNIGGLIGDTYADISLSNVINTGSVSSSNARAGGLVGSAASGNVQASINLGQIVASTSAGGLFGRVTTMNISTSFNSGHISKADYSGGLIGFTSSSAILSNCFNKGNITESSLASGGLIGHISSGTTVNSSYSSAKILTSDGYIGGIVGTGSGTLNLIHNYWDTELSGIINYYKALGDAPNEAERKMTNQMFQQSEYDSSFWDFNLIWQIEEGSDYPKLRFHEEL